MDSATRICKECHIEKSIEDFHPTRGGQYHRWKCKLCFHKFQRLRRSTVLRETRQAYRRNRVLYKYGLTIESYQELLDKQEGKCAICGTHVDNLKRGLQVDHNHRTGDIRALLCYSCNGMLGMANDNAETLRKAIIYLEHFA